MNAISKVEANGAPPSAIAIGRLCANPTMPAFAGEPVTAGTSSGYATSEICEPRPEIACPLPHEHELAIATQRRTHPR
jgi:hypothetical protein